MGTWTKKEGRYPMVECVCYADDIKYKGGVYQSQWHFLNFPFFDQGGGMDDYRFKYPAHNITEAIDALTMWLNKAEGYDSTYIHDMVIRKTNSSEEGLSSAMRFLIHHIGDIHQPMHTTARVNENYPRGDTGGNAFKLPNHYGASNLHAVWDKVMYEFKYYPKLPFNDKDWDTNGAKAAEYMDEFKIPLKTLEETDPVEWAKEAHEIVKDFVYVGITENEELPDKYKAEAMKIAKRQIVIAGQRLYRALKALDLDQWTDGTTF